MVTSEDVKQLQSRRRRRNLAGAEVEEAKRAAAVAADQFVIDVSQPGRPLAQLILALPFSAQQRREKLNVVDLGCGTGVNSTKTLANVFPNASIWGIDRQSALIDYTKSSFTTGNGLPDNTSTPDASITNRVQFICDDIRVWCPTSLASPATGHHVPQIDLYFANTVMNFLTSAQQIHLVERLLTPQTSHDPTISTRPPVLAFQMPEISEDPAFTILRDLAHLPAAPWRRRFTGATFLEMESSKSTRQSASQFHDDLAPFCSSLNTWSTVYNIVLDDYDSLNLYLQSTSILKTYYKALRGDPQLQTDFMRQYMKRLHDAYPRRSDGKIILEDKRLFVVAVGKTV